MASIEYLEEGRDIKKSQIIKIFVLQSIVLLDFFTHKSNLTSEAVHIELMVQCVDER